MGRYYECIDNINGAFPLGVKRIGEYVHFAVSVSGDKQVYLCIYDMEGDEPAFEIEFPKENRLGEIRYMDVKGLDKKSFKYGYRYSDGGFIPDCYAARVCGWENWGDLSRNEKHELYAYVEDDFDWSDDTLPNIELNDMIIYRLHVRGFTQHASSKVKHKGTFKGVEEKLGYLKELGITTIELMLPTEFNEVRALDYNSSLLVENSININYWGYGPGYYFAPKAAYASGDAVKELKELVKAVHKAGLELVIELNFSGDITNSCMIDCVRYWTEVYHVDGIKLGGNAPLYAIAEEPALKNIKLFAYSWEGCKKRKNLISCNDDYMNDMRRFLKGDENTISGYLKGMTANPTDGAVVNYLANNNTFTMLDMVSYDVKHNEENGEANRDGRDYNFSWNCGFEGATRKKKIIDLRRKLLQNAYMMLFLSQGIPMLRSGDEMGQSKNGNNNAYCQDNKVSWVNWRQLQTNSDIYSFVKGMIAFRKAHDMFRRKRHLSEEDYNSLGLPEFSIHGVNPWYPQYEHFRRQLGLMYNGSYSENKSEESFYVIVNMHWEEHEFLLPKPFGKKKWSVIVDTAKPESIKINAERAEDMPAIDNQKAYEAAPRSMVILKTTK